MIAVEQNAVYYFIYTNCATVDSYFNPWEKKNLSYNPQTENMMFKISIEISRKNRMSIDI